MLRIVIELQETTRTDLLCIACGGFLGHARGAGYAVETAGAEEHQSGVHKRCVKLVRARRAGAKVAA